jgi:hypothetical protein
LDRGINLHRDEVDNILYNGKCIENRSQRWDPGYYWLRSTMEPSKARTKGGRIVGLIRLYEPINDDEATFVQQRWFIHHYSMHMPIELIWTAPAPYEWIPPRGAVNRFRLPINILQQLLRM